MSLDEKPLAITMGDPSGIGPEIIISALEKQDANFKAVVLGCPNIIERAIKVNKSKMKIHKNEKSLFLKKKKISLSFLAMNSLRIFFWKKCKFLASI